MTSRVLGNVIKSISGGDDKPLNVDALDGYDELPDAEKKKVKKALEQGHVDDKDWRHEKGGNKPTEKKASVPKKGKGKKNVSTKSQLLMIVS